MNKLTNEFNDSLICNTGDVFKDCLDYAVFQCKGNGIYGVSKL